MPTYEVILCILWLGKPTCLTVDQLAGRLERACVASPLVGIETHEIPAKSGGTRPFRVYTCEVDSGALLEGLTFTTSAPQPPWPIWRDR